MELTQKFKHLEENIKLLKEIKESVSFEAIKNNRRYEWEVRYGLLESIQIVIDISCKISSEFNLGNPSNYRECIELLAKFNYLQEETAKKVVAMVGLRNLLVHEYVTIDSEKLHQYLNFLDDFLDFVNDVRENL